MKLKDALNAGHVFLEAADGTETRPYDGQIVWVCEACSGWRFGKAGDPKRAANADAYDMGYRGDPPKRPEEFVHDPDTGDLWMEAYFNGWSRRLDDLASEED